MKGKQESIHIHRVEKFEVDGKSCETFKQDTLALLIPPANLDQIRPKQSMPVEKKGGQRSLRHSCGRSAICRTLGKYVGKSLQAVFPIDALLY